MNLHDISTRHGAFLERVHKFGFDLPKICVSKDCPVSQLCVAVSLTSPPEGFDIQQAIFLLEMNLALWLHCQVAVTMDPNLSDVMVTLGDEKALEDAFGKSLNEVSFEEITLNDEFRSRIKIYDQLMQASSAQTVHADSKIQKLEWMLRKLPESFQQEIAQTNYDSIPASDEG
jgi:hypothetical protein